MRNVTKLWWLAHPTLTEFSVVSAATTAASLVVSIVALHATGDIYIGQTETVAGMVLGTPSGAVAGVLAADRLLWTPTRATLAASLGALLVPLGAAFAMANALDAGAVEWLLAPVLILLANSIISGAAALAAWRVLRKPPTRRRRSADEE
jgi:hypothetical protein